MADYRGFLPKSPAGLTVVAGVFVGAADAGLWEAAGDGVAAGVGVADSENNLDGD